MDGTDGAVPSGGRLAGVVTLVALVAAAVAIAVVTAVPGRPTESDGARYAPPDGTSVVLAVAGTSVVAIDEHQVVAGTEGLSEMPRNLAAAVLERVPDLDRRQIWRWSTTTRSGSLRPRALSSLQTVGPDGIRRLASYGGTYTTVFDPPQRILPARVARGVHWSDSGDAFIAGMLTYRHRGRVTAVDRNGCATVHRSTTVALTDGAPLDRRREVERWCPGRGVVSGRAVQITDTGQSEIRYATAGSRRAQRLLADVPAPSADAGGAGPTGGPGTWRAEDLATVAVDPVLGVSAVTGVRTLAPVASPDGLLVVPVDNGADLLAFRIATPEAGADPALVEQWRVHPGGALLQVALVGDLVVVSTADRRVVAYDRSGFRRWSLETGDLVVSRAVGTADGGVVVHALDGTVTVVEADSGVVRWRARTRADADVAPVALPGSVVAFDRSGQVLALDAADGRRRWSHSGDPVTAAAAVDGRVVATTAAATAWTLDASGHERWSVPIGFVGTTVADSGAAVVAGAGAVVALDPRSGAVVHRWSASAVAAADDLVLAQDERLCVDRTGGRRIRCFDLAPPAAGITRALLVDAGGGWVVDSTLAVVRIAPAEGAGR